MNNAVVSCTGANCGVCSAMETVSNLYNYFLVICFVVAVLILVIAGFTYISSGGSRVKTQKALNLLKNGIIGFSIIILGWLIIQTVIKITGYQNAGSWWQFQCGTEGGTGSPSNPSLFSDYYQNMKVYPDINAFIKSGQKQGKIKGPVDALSIASQLKSLEDGEILRLLAPINLNSINGKEDSYLPLMTVSKNGDNLNLDSTGEYWNLIQNLYPKVKDKLSSSSDQELLNKLLGTANLTDNRNLIDGNGDALDASNAELTNLYKSLADSLGAVSDGDRSATGTSNQADLQNASLSELIALAQSYQGGNSTATDQMIGKLTSEVLKLVSTVVVEKDTTADTGTFNPLCQNPNSGDWIKNGCNKDSDGDKVVDGEDRCPNTSAAEKTQVNKTKGKYYGCSCSQIGDVPKNCPPDQCVGDNWATYPTGNRTCKDGKLEAYTCQPVNRNYDETCVDPNVIADTGTNNWTNQNDNSAWSGNSNSNWNINNNSYFQSSNKNNTNRNPNTNAPKSNSGLGSGTGGKGKTSDDFSNKKPGPDVPSGDGNGGWDSPAGKGDIESIKKALRRIHEKDPLRYEMIFRFVRTIARTGFSGGLCYGCGYIESSASLPIGIVDQIIAHEATHSMHACVTGWGGFSSAQLERIACANEMGSVCRREGHEDMVEFPRQSTNIEYKGKEVRGYVARRLGKVNPSGDLGTSAFSWPISYAYGYGDTTMGPFHYGDHDANLVLGLIGKEENVIRKGMESTAKCLSKPTKDLPPVEACDKEGIPEINLR